MDPLFIIKQKSLLTRFILTLGHILSQPYSGYLHTTYKSAIKLILALQLLCDIKTLLSYLIHRGKGLLS